VIWGLRSSEKTQQELLHRLTSTLRTPPPPPPPEPKPKPMKFERFEHFNFGSPNFQNFKKPVPPSKAGTSVSTFDCGDLGFRSFERMTWSQTVYKHDLEP
jgi:hypothetical protein